jgi:predicted enzyme related to lactoylglutathione lyase
MPTIDAHDPGTICWIDLASTDAATATVFYCELFGWTAAEPAEDAGGYRMLLSAGRQVAGLAPVWGDTDGSTWSTYVASADADDTCAAAVANGGEVVMDAMDVLDAGRMAVLRDPAGAQVSVWQPGVHQGYEVHGEPGAPIWSDLITRDVAAVKPFYGSVFGWTAEEQEFDGVPYTVWRRRDKLVGGAFEMDETWPQEAQPHWLIYIATDDCDATAQRCEALGGTVSHPPGDIAAGRCAMLEDPSGGAFAVITLHGPA